MTQIRLVIADGQPLFREGLVRRMRQDPGLRVVAELADDRAVLEAIRRLGPEIAILDAGLRWARVIETVTQHRLRTLLILLAADVRPGEVFEAVAAGARGYLSKRVNGDIVCEAVRRVAAGGVALCEEAQTCVTGEIRLRHRDERGLLAPRELDVLALLAEGMTNAEIAARLHIAPTTVKSYCVRIYERLGVRERVGAVVEAMRRGLLD
jgi:two-component system, NarL family, nitrate/nitrite response regulator NarL